MSPIRMRKRLLGSYKIPAKLTQPEASAPPTPLIPSVRTTSDVLVLVRANRVAIVVNLSVTGSICLGDGELLQSSQKSPLVT